MKSIMLLKLRTGRYSMIMSYMTGMLIIRPQIHLSHHSPVASHQAELTPMRRPKMNTRRGTRKPLTLWQIGSSEKSSKTR